MCDKCQQLEADIRRYRKLLAQDLDPLNIELQRYRKLANAGLDLQTIERINDVIDKLAQRRFD